MKSTFYESIRFITYDFSEIPQVMNIRINRLKFKHPHYILLIFFYFREKFARRLQCHAFELELEQNTR
jgi:hypothetical protein